MKILFVSSCVPYPLTDGARLKIFYLLKYLSRKHKIVFVGYHTNDNERKYIHVIRDFVDDVYLIKQARISPAKKLLRIHCKYPVSAGLCMNSEMENALRRVIAENFFDVIHVDGAFMAEAVFPFNKVPKIIVPTDCISLLWKYRFETERTIFRKLICLINWWKVRNYESDFYKGYDGCIVVSPEDQEAIKKLIPNLDVRVIPNGIDYERFQPSGVQEETNSLIFTGVMSYFPNVDAAVSFSASVLPIIRERIPDVKFYIVGKDPAPEIIRLKKNCNIVVTGFVDDMRAEISRAAVYVSPLRFAHGFKNKILEAMAMEKPIVATSHSINGIAAAPNRDLLIEDEPELFAQAVVRLLSDRRLRSEFGRNARRLVVEKYHWSNIVAQYEKVYLEKSQDDRHQKTYC